MIFFALKLIKEQFRVPSILDKSPWDSDSNLGPAVHRAHCQAWAPIQRRTTKFILKLPYSSNISYKSRLQTLNLIPICYWHELLDLTFFFKLTHGLVNVNSSVLPEVLKYGRRTRSSTSNVNKYIIKKCKTTTYQKSFLIRTSRIWNCLADELDLSSSTLASFKSVIFNHCKSALAVSLWLWRPTFLQVYLFKM